MVAPRMRSLPGHGQHLDHAVRLAVGDGAVEIVDAVGRDLVGDALLLRLGLVQADARDLRIGEGRPGNHRVVGAELLEPAEQRVHRRVPGLVRGGVRELERAGDVAAGVDVRVDGLQELVGLHGALLGRADAELLQPVAGGVRDAPDGAQQLVERDAHFPAGVLAISTFSPFSIRNCLRLVAEQHARRPPSRKRARTISEISGSSRTRMRGSISTCVTCEPKRAKACASSQPIGPPPSTSSRCGSARRSHSVSEVR